MATKLKPVDVVTVGVGLTGTILAKELADTGLQVVGLERGRWRDTDPDFAMPGASAFPQNGGYNQDEVFEEAEGVGVTEVLSMRKKARIVGLISRLNEKKQRVRIPKGECEIDEGPDGIGPYVLYWKEDGRELGAELTLVEFANHVGRELRIEGEPRRPRR